MFKFRFKVDVQRTGRSARSGGFEGSETRKNVAEIRDAAFPFDGEEESVPAATAGLPGEFRKPEEFRREKEQRNESPPRLSLPAPPVYLLLISAMASWCFYGYTYNKTHFPVSLEAVITFFAVFLVLFLVTMFFRDLNRRVRLYPVLRRIVALRPGTFVVTEHENPQLSYARETWIGLVSFEEGGEDRDAYTRLEARMREPRGRLSIRKKGVLDKVFSSSPQQLVPLAEREFSRKFKIWSPDAGFAREFLDSRVERAITRLAEIGKPAVDIDGTFVRVSVGADISKPRKEAALVQFLAEAETIVGAAARENLATHLASGGFGRAVPAAEQMDVIRKLVLGVLGVVVLVSAGMNLETWRFHRRFVLQAQEFRNQVPAQDPSLITPQDLVDLPAVVQKYLVFSGVIGRKRIRSIHYQGKGAVRATAASGWQEMEGEYYFTVNKPSLCWYARREVAAGLQIAEIGSYFGGQGKSIIKPFSVFPSRERADAEVTRALLIRLLTGLPVYPTLFLDAERVRWLKSGVDSAEVVFRDSGSEWPAVFFFNPDGSVARVELMRHLGSGKGTRLERWTGTYDRYREFDGYRLPTKFESAWNLTSGDVTFARFETEAIKIDEALAEDVPQSAGRKAAGGAGD